MKKLYYPAVFHPEDEGYWVDFPDLPGCFTQGDTFEETVFMCKDALGTWFTSVEGIEIEYPKPSNPSAIQLKEGEFVVVVEYDSLYWAKRTNSKSVKKTLTIPGWLDEIAKKKKVNYSQTLQEALIQKLDL